MRRWNEENEIWKRDNERSFRCWFWPCFLVLALFYRVVQSRLHLQCCYELVNVCANIHSLALIAWRTSLGGPSGSRPILDTCLLSPICTISLPFWISGSSTFRFKPTSSGNWPLVRNVLQLYTVRKSRWLSACFDGFLPSGVLLTKSGVVTESSIW